MKRSVLLQYLALIVIASSMTAVESRAQSGSLFRTNDQAAAPANRIESKPTPISQDTQVPSAAPFSVAPRVDGNEGLTPILPPDELQPISPYSLQAATWGMVPANPKRTLGIHDIVTIRVDELATASAQGNVQSRKSTLLDGRLNDWIDWVDFDTIKPAPQSDGDPRIQANTNEAYRAQSTLQTREQLTFNIAAEIVDIRPNGRIVLHATKTSTLNDNMWEISFTGECRAQDIGPDNVILSRNILYPKITKNEHGHVRDGYSRGWLQRLYARFKAF